MANMEAGMERAIVPEVVITPPVSPVPAVIEVTVPVPQVATYKAPAEVELTQPEVKEEIVVEPLAATLNREALEVEETLKGLVLPVP